MDEQETRKRVAEILKKLEEESPLGNPAGGRRCPKCGCVMAHYRLHGYRCVRGCT